MNFIRPTGDLLHLATGVLLACVGFGRSSVGTTRVTVIAVGSLYLLFDMLNSFTALLDDLPIGLYRNGEDVVHVVIGLLSVFASTLSPKDDGPPARGRNFANTA